MEDLCDDGVYHLLVEQTIYGQDVSNPQAFDVKTMKRREVSYLSIFHLATGPSKLTTNYPAQGQGGIITPRRIFEVLLWEHDEDTPRVGGFVADTSETSRLAVRSGLFSRLPDDHMNQQLLGASWRLRPHIRPPGRRHGMRQPIKNDTDCD